MDKNIKEILGFDNINIKIESDLAIKNYIKLINIECWNNTKKICETIPLPPQSIKYKHVQNVNYTKSKNTSSIIRVHNMDTIDCAFIYENPLVLNLADDLYPGGWINAGSSAQEESLFRRTNYHLTLVKQLYPISESEVIYSPNITVIKHNEQKNWEIMDCFKQLDFIACPAIKYPFLKKDGCLSEDDVEILETKIETIIQVAVKHKHSAIIFGAMGCGAWENPPEDVATIFKRLLKKYDGAVANYIFAILDNISDDSVIDENKKSNYDIFRNILLN